MPDLAGLDAGGAKRATQNAGLELRVDARRPDGTVPRDHVIEQEPNPAAILRRQRAVRVRVSDGQQDPVVPSVVGQIERTAEIVLAGKNRSTSPAGPKSARRPMPPGWSSAQDPAATRQASKVTLLVNRGEAGASYVMPDVIGAMAARAVDVLRRRGFRVTVGADRPLPGPSARRRRPADAAGGLPDWLG